MSVRWIGVFAVFGVTVVACRGDDIAPPDVFVDYDARAVPSDVAPIDAGPPTDAIDAADVTGP